MPCNPFSLIILFSNPFNASNLGDGEWWGQQSKGSLGCGVVLVLAELGCVMPEHPSASLRRHSPREASQTWGQLTG